MKVNGLVQEIRVVVTLGKGIGVSLDDATSVVRHEELHVSPMEGVQNLEEDRRRFAFQLDDRRHELILSAIEDKLCVDEVVTNFIAELFNRFVILRVFTRDELGTQFQKRRDTFWSCCLVHRVKRLSGEIKAKRPISLR